MQRESIPATSAESRFFLWCWEQLTIAQRQGMLTVAQTGCPNGTGLTTMTRHRLEVAGMIKREGTGYAFTDLGESVMWEGAIEASDIARSEDG